MIQSMKQFSQEMQYDSWEDYSENPDPYHNCLTRIGLGSMKHTNGIPSSRDATHCKRTTAERERPDYKKAVAKARKMIENGNLAKDMYRCGNYSAVCDVWQEVKGVCYTSLTRTKFEEKAKEWKERWSK